MVLLALRISVNNKIVKRKKKYIPGARVAYASRATSIVVIFMAVWCYGATVVVLVVLTIIVLDIM